MHDYTHLTELHARVDHGHDGTDGWWHGEWNDDLDDDDCLSSQVGDDDADDNNYNHNEDDEFQPIDPNDLQHDHKMSMNDGSLA